jgi:hypothetical protein
MDEKAVKQLLRGGRTDIWVAVGYRAWWWTVGFLVLGALSGPGCSTSAGTGGGSGGAAGNVGMGSGGTGGNATGGSAAGGSAAGGKGGTAGSGDAGKTGGGGAGAGGAAGHGTGGAKGGASGGGGSACPGAQPLTGSECRSLSDCPGGGNGYYCTTDPGGVSSACATPFCVGPVNHDCTVDTDCPAGDHCLSTIVKCCNQTSMTCHVVCNSTTVTCATGTVCSPGTKGGDDYGCAPQPCNAGYTCPSGFQCAVGGTGADAHGCQALPCSQTGCPANFTCSTTATVGGCTPKQCSTDCDCDSGFCVGGSCSSALGTCVMPPS